MVEKLKDKNCQMIPIYALSSFSCKIDRIAMRLRYVDYKNTLLGSLGIHLSTETAELHEFYKRHFRLIKQSRDQHIRTSFSCSQKNSGGYRSGFLICRTYLQWVRLKSCGYLFTTRRLLQHPGDFTTFLQGKFV